MSSKLAQPGSKEPELRIMLIGKTGNGKTSTALTKRSASSQTTECKTETAEFVGQKLVVIDTPGLMNTEKQEDEVKKDIAGCIAHAAPGVHVFLLVLRGDKALTKYDKDVMESIQKIFGKESKNYTLALFTNGDKGVPSDEEVKEEFVNNYIVGHHSFNNKPPARPEQVAELLEKINSMVENNTEKLYTNDMFKKVEEVKEELRSDGMTAPNAMLELTNGFLSGIMGKKLVELVDGFAKFIARKVGK